MHTCARFQLSELAEVDLNVLLGGRGGEATHKELSRAARLLLLLPDLARLALHEAILRSTTHYPSLGAWQLKQGGKRPVNGHPVGFGRHVTRRVGDE